MSEVYERIRINRLFNASQARTFAILDGFSTILGERSLPGLVVKIEDIFPSLFKFEKVGLLFACEITNDLFKIQTRDRQSNEK